ncbi:MAG: TetR/AcrR family transcriptional regulator [Candidatus Dormibacteraeota bacterium]|nr:TetR/AcrR family transcriptional regulator [Candidatus Dormibacteraeota bacterium]
MSTPDIAGFRANPRPGRKRRNLPTEAWRERILQAARVVFGDEGYDGASMEDIAALAGLSRAALYRMFPGRRDLCNAVITDDAQRLAGQLLLEFATLPTAREKVRALVSVFFRFVEEHHERNRVFSNSATGADPAVAEALRVVRAALAGTLAQAFAGAEAATSDGERDLSLIANGIIALAEGAAVSWMQGPHAERERAVDIVTATALRALKPWI